MKHDLLQAFLIEVRDQGSNRTDRRKLDWMLGRQNLNASAYELLLNEWEQLGSDRKLLRGFQYGDYLTFTVANVEPIISWAP